MAQQYSGSFLCINATGVTVTTGAASAAVNIPVDASGKRPNYIRVAATGESYINVLGAAATQNDILVQPSDAVTIQVPRGVTQVNYIQGANPAKVNIVPLDNS